MGAKFQCIFSLFKILAMRGVLMRCNDRCPSGQEKKQSTCRNSGQGADVRKGYMQRTIHNVIQTDFDQTANG
jgi:hypothetical protein